MQTDWSKKKELKQMQAQVQVQAQVRVQAQMQAQVLAQVQAQTRAFPRWSGRPCPISERKLRADGKAPTLGSSCHKLSGYSTKFVFDEQGLRRPRFLAPRECARLMGFPDDFPAPAVSEGDRKVPSGMMISMGFKHPWFRGIS